MTFNAITSMEEYQRKKSEFLHVNEIDYFEKIHEMVMKEANSMKESQKLTMCVRNIVSTVNMGLGTLSAKHLYKYMNGHRFPKEFTSMFIKLKDGPITVTVSVFQCGKIVIVGAKNPAMIIHAVRRLKVYLESAGIKVNECKYKIHNIVVNGLYPHNLDVVRMSNDFFSGDDFFKFDSTMIDESNNNNSPYSFSLSSYKEVDSEIPSTSQSKSSEKSTKQHNSLSNFEIVAVKEEKRDEFKKKHLQKNVGFGIRNENGGTGGDINDLSKTALIIVVTSDGKKVAILVFHGGHFIVMGPKEYSQIEELKIFLEFLFKRYKTEKNEESNSHQKKRREGMVSMFKATRKRRQMSLSEVMSSMVIVRSINHEISVNYYINDVVNKYFKKNFLEWTTNKKSKSLKESLSDFFNQIKKKRNRKKQSWRFFDVPITEIHIESLVDHFHEYQRRFSMFFQRDFIVGEFEGIKGDYQSCMRYKNNNKTHSNKKKSKNSPDSVISDELSEKDEMLRLFDEEIDEMMSGKKKKTKKNKSSSHNDGKKTVPVMMDEGSIPTYDEYPQDYVDILEFQFRESKSSLFRSKKKESIRKKHDMEILSIINEDKKMVVDDDGIQQLTIDYSSCSGEKGDHQSKMLIDDDIFQQEKHHSIDGIQKDEEKILDDMLDNQDDEEEEDDDEEEEEEDDDDDEDDRIPKSKFVESDESNIFDHLFFKSILTTFRVSRSVPYERLLREGFTNEENKVFSVFQKCHSSQEFSTKFKCINLLSDETLKHFEPLKFMKKISKLSTFRSMQKNKGKFWLFFQEFLRHEYENFIFCNQFLPENLCQFTHEYVQNGWIQRLGVDKWK